MDNVSQPKDFGPDEHDPLDLPIKSIDELVQIFLDAKKPKHQWLLGIEYEMFGQKDQGQNPLPYEGKVSITNLFLHIIKKSQNFSDPYQPLLEGQNIVGLKCQRAIIALEPGGQIEVAMMPFSSLDDVTKLFSEVVLEIENASFDLGIKLFALGVHPMAKREDMAVVKKARYAIMRGYMSKLSGLGLDMMTRSCAIQINLDYENEADMAQKMRKAALLMPIYALICSSSAFIEGQPAPFALMRGQIWHETDPRRTGIPEIIFQKDFGYLSWINLALDVPMYFLRRDNQYFDVRGQSFRDFIKHGLLGKTATLRDFVDQLSTVFTDVRLKPIIELRSPDSLPVPYVNALTALTWALFYDEQASQKSQHLLEDISYKELLSLRNNIIAHGRKAKFRQKDIFELVQKLFDIANDSLNAKDKTLLLPIKHLLEKNTTVAEWISTNYPNLNKNNFPHLVDRFSPFKSL